MPLGIASSAFGRAVWTLGRIAPSGFLKMSDTIFLSWEAFENLYDIHGPTPIDRASLPEIDENVNTLN